MRPSSRRGDSPPFLQKYGARATQTMTYVTRSQRPQRLPPCGGRDAVFSLASLVCMLRNQNWGIAADSTARRGNRCRNCPGRHAVPSGVASFFARSGLLVQQSLPLAVAHPAVALLAGISLTWVVAVVWRSPTKALQCLAVIEVSVLILQLTLGALNVVLLAPMWLQMVHLFVADVLWITLVLLAAESLTIAESQATFTRPVYRLKLGRIPTATRPLKYFNRRLCLSCRKVYLHHC